MRQELKYQRQRPVVRREDVVLEKKKVIRPEIWRFARSMEEAMKHNDRERGDTWRQFSLGILESRLACSLLKFVETKDKRHLVNVANYAMMTYHKSDVARGGSYGTAGNGRTA